MKKILIIGFFVLCLAGCSKMKQPSNTVTIWHWMTDRQEAFDQLAAQYEKETGIHVDFELFAPSDIYSRKITAAAQARVLPDVFGILDEKKSFASFIEGGFVADLTSEYQKDDGAWQDSLFKKALNVNRFEPGNTYDVKPGIYGVPIDVTNIQMLYNKKLLARIGLKKPPRTFDEFLEATDALKRIGISGFVSGWGETWMIDTFAMNYAFNIMGQGKVTATFKGEVPYTDADWIKVFNIFKQMADRGALIDGIAIKGNKYAEQDFALERAAFAFNGSWCVNVYSKMNPNLDYGVMLPPAVNKNRPMAIYGGAGSSFVVSSTSPNKDKAIAFLKWLTAKKQQAFLAKETLNLPANREALSSVPRVLSEFASAMKYTTHPSLWEVNEDSLVIEAFDKGVQSIIIGEKTPIEVAQEVQAIKVRELKRKK